MSSIVQKIKSLVVLISLLFLTGGIGAWAQTDYSGTYFIANGNGYKSADVANNFYLVPATNSNYESDADKPHLTTSKTGKVLNCCWRVEKSGDYYHIIHVADGKYLTANPKYDGTSGNNVGRLRVHLETMTEPDNSTLFEIKTNSNGGYNIRHKDMTDKINNSTTTYLDPAGGNVDGTNLTSLRQMDTSSGKVNVGGGIGYWTDEPAARWQFEEVPQNNTYTYNIVDSQGNIAVKMNVTGQPAARALSGYTDIPTEIRSHYIDGEKISFYTFSESYSTPEELLELLSDEHKIVATPVTNNANIYVTYTTDHLSEKFLHLRGARGFNIKTDDGFIYDDNGTLSYEESRNDQTSHLWYISGGDPYNVQIENVGTGKYLVFSPAPTFALAATATTKFIIMPDGASGDSTYEQVNLMTVTGTGVNNFAKAEIQAYPFDITTNYHLVDKAGKLIVSIPNVTESELKLPADWVSPLVSTYHYFKTASIDGDGVYTLSDPIDKLLDVGSGGDIYVNYDVNNSINITGGKTYLIKFSDGEFFHQEDGHDGINEEGHTEYGVTSATKAVYPYNNGDFNLNVYGQEQWESQLANGASTRTRWLWYIESRHNGTPLTGNNADPYHVVIKSRQDHLIKESDVIKYQPGSSYLQTYKPSDYASVVTNIAYENAAYHAAYPSIMPTTIVNGQPTEYMILGTSLQNMKLKTFNEVEGERRVVNSFEQYWKNNPIVQNLVGANPAANNSTLIGRGWHMFNSWAYSAEYNADAKTKTLANKGHWYQTISMGSGEFTLEEVSLAPQAILLDQHGWEVVRVPLSDTETLRKYNSPMVEEYQWYAKADKSTGYHKYDVSDETVAHTTTSLTDVSWVPSEKAPDYYVTYTVKPLYAGAYTGAATAAATQASAYLLKQGDKCAKISGSNIVGVDAPTSMKNVATDIQWYLRPNFDIDREMGYRYKGESGAQVGADTKNATEQEYYNNGKNGFDPYNVQIQNRSNTNRYFTANTTGTTLSSGVWTGTSRQISLQNLSVNQTATGYDHTTLNVTNSTFMIVGEGNMRLMPRFDNTKVANKDGDHPFRILATQDDELNDAQTFWVELIREAKEVSSSSEITDMNGFYLLAEGFTPSGSIGTSDNPFRGTIDGQMNTISGLSSPLVAYADGATIKNVILDNVGISSGNENGNAGAICCEATGDTRIYNCGVLSGSVGGGNNVGGLVGLLDGTARVINCYSYADITGGTTVGGIVGNNNATTTAASITTMVMNCMFYGNITGGTTKSPVYGGKNINNLNNGGLNTFNYYSYEKLTGGVTDNQYNCALAVEDKYLNRFEYYRLLLNSNKKLAAYYATGSADNGDKMAKWVLETADRTIENPKPYPVLKAQGYYPSIINYDIENAPDSASVGRNHGGKLGKTLSVTISGVGSNAPSGASITTGNLTLQRTDKDFDRFNFNYDKVQLPYYNEVGTGNYTDYKVVTGWKITAITAVEGDPYTSANYPTTGITDFPNHNYADRKSSNKDLYSVSGRVFSQGAYFDVPYGVESITIEPYWGQAAYISDQNYDVVYKNDYTGKQNVTQTGAQINTFNEQTVHHSMTNALNALTYGSTVYDKAVVLVGNLHLDGVPSGGDKAFTMMSVDMDNDHEPDYSLIYHHKDRTAICPIRFDFLNILGTAQAQKPNGASLVCNFTIFKTKGWFEVTNTSSFYTSQLEYENLANVTKADAPLILLGGVIDQFVSTQSSDVSGKTIYIHVGGNVWINEFGMGTHSDGGKSTPHVPVSVTGGEFPGFYLTGTYKADAQVRTDNAECYISGGYIHEAAGASLEQIDGNVRWQIYNADIDNFFGGGINDAKPIKGNITTDIYNSHVGLFCGGPKFGNMQASKIVTTNAEGCTFGKYFGAGYGGTSLAKKKYYDNSGNQNWATLQGYYTTDRGNYFNGTSTGSSQTAGKDYGKKGPGVATDFDYEFFVWTSGTTGARLYVKFASFSLAQCNDVSSTLKKCTVETNFYGGGNLGKVVGTATSVLEDCTVKGSVYGAGYSASLPTVEVRDGGFTKNPNYNSKSGMFEPGIFSDTTTFTWQNAATAGKTLTDGQSGSDLENHILYTNTELTGLGEVANSNLTIKGTTTVAESVYGGGEESGVAGDTEVSVTGGTIGTTGDGDATWGNVYGGGKGLEDNVNAGLVKGNTNVTISGSPAILHNVYGGGAFGSVGTFTYDSTTGFPNSLGENTGTANVTIKGGTFGSNGQNNGMVFGSSRGLEGDPEAEGSYVDKIAWVGNTNVVIGTTSAEDNTNPWIKGSVYGGGENGHNFKDALVTIHSGTIGIAEGSPITDDGGTPDDPSDDITYSGARYPSRGNVYGSGCGTDTYKKTVSEVEKTYFDFNAGIVRGNTTVQIDGGHVVHNVYGGGAMGSVGTFTLDENGKPTSCAANTGTCTVTVSGGQIGVARAKMAGYGKGGPDDYGHVFGAGRGEMHDPNQYPNLETCAYFNKAILNISVSAFLTGSAYGGSESGHVLGDTEVNISGGQIGCGKNATKPYGVEVWGDNYVPSDDLECESWPYEAPYAPHDLYANATGDVDKYPSGKSTEGGRLEASDGHTYYGNVFGGGSGCVPYYDTTDGISKYLSTAGSVEGKTTVNISGGHILTNVYGGCEATNVKGSATVKMTGGTVGVPRTFRQIVAHPVTCYVFGAGKGDQRISFNKETNVDRATVSIEGGKVYGSVFGGGEDGHVFQNTTVTIGKTGEEGPTIGTLGTSYVDGNVFGGGRGFSGDALTAGNVGGSVELNIESGKILGSVYGGGRLASVGYGLYLVDEEIEEGGEMIKPYGILRPDDKYDGSYPNPSTKDASTYYSNGRGYITINISGGTIGNDNEYIYNPTAEQKAEIPNTTFDYQNHLQYTKGGNVFTGGMGRLYAQDGTTLLLLWPKLGKCKGTTLNMTGGTVKSSIYGGGEIGAVAENATVNINGGTVGTKVVDSEDATKYYYFGSVFGGGKGSVDNVDDISEAGTTGGNVEVHLNKTVASDDSKKGAIVHQVFGCNDMNGSPKGTVTVHVYSTQTPENANISTKPAKNSEKYDVEAVYGGGNLAAYIPTVDNSKASVTIDGCDLTSINTVYGGGNAASVPASEVIVKGTYEIGTIFGGGNGNDKLPSGEDNPGANVGYKADGTTTYGKGTTFVDLQGGLIHDAYGGSNAKGKIWKTASVSLNEAKDGESGAPCCPLVLDEVYGAGNEAYMEGGTSIDLVCISKLGTLYGGAKNADVNGGVMMNIQSGNFERVFGGNNIGGNINGAIEVNIEETGCYPIIIGELYGGGNLAAYSVYGYNDDGTIKESGETPLYSHPTLNIKSFTSIGNIYGGGYGETAVMVGNPTVNINEVVGEPGDYPTEDDDDDYDATGFKGKDMTIGDHTVTLPAHVRGKIGAIGNVFGGGNAAKVIGNTTVNIGTAATIDFETKASGEPEPRTGVDVVGAMITGNVYGGGNAADVTGDAKVNVGNKVDTPAPAPTPEPTPEP